MTSYTNHIALIVPAAQKDRANQAAAALTGRPPDLQTFRRGKGFLDDDGTEYLLAGPTPMKDEQVEALPLLEAQFDLDAEWETIAVWDGGRKPLTTVDAWAAGLGLVREVVEEEITA